MRNKTSWRLSGLAIVSLLISLILCYLLISATIRGRMHTEEMYIEQLIMEKSIEINNIISKLAYKTEALATIVIHGNGNIDDFDKAALSLVDDPVIRNVLLAPDGIVSKVYPLEGNDVLLGYNLFGDSHPGSKEARTAQDLGILILGGPQELYQGGMGVVCRMPVFLDTPDEAKKFWGLVSITLKFPEILDNVRLDTFDSRNMAYKLWRIDQTGAEQIISSNTHYIGPNSRVIKKTLEFLNVQWYFEVSSLSKWYEHLENDMLVVAGLFVSFLVMFIMQNNFELKHMKSTLEIMARTDALTGIYNRRYMEESLKVIIKASSRSGSMLSLLMLDVDFFKNYNDTYGHNKGDECLKKIAETISSNLLRDDDFVARFGGEEFVVVLPNTNETGANLVAERLLASIWDTKMVHEKSAVAGFVTVSIGGTTAKADHSISGNEYIKCADKALYVSKQTGRNKYTFVPFENQI